MFIQTCSVYRLELDMKQHIKWVRLLLIQVLVQLEEFIAMALMCNKCFMNNKSYLHKE